MAEEPEKVLPEHRSAVLRGEHHRPIITINERECECTCQNWERKQGQHTCDENRPGENGHPEHSHARCSHAENGCHEVDRAKDGAQAAHRQAQQP